MIKKSIRGGMLLKIKTQTGASLMLDGCYVTGVDG
jgi:hypothetical protein